MCKVSKNPYSKWRLLDPSEACPISDTGVCLGPTKKLCLPYTTQPLIRGQLIILLPWKMGRWGATNWRLGCANILTEKGASVNSDNIKSNCVEPCFFLQVWMGGLD